MSETLVLPPFFENLDTNLVLISAFILGYSGLILLNKSTTKFANFSRNLVYMSSGLLFTYYCFQVSYLEPYREFEYLVAFLLALSFRDLLPVIVDFTVDVCTSKLKQLDNKIKSEEANK